MKCTAGQPCIPASVLCSGICFQKSVFAELVGTDREECTNPLILTLKEEGGAERVGRPEHLVSSQSVIRSQDAF